MNIIRFILLLAIGFTGLGMYAQNENGFGNETRNAETGGYFLSEIRDCRYLLKDSPAINNRENIFEAVHEIEPEILSEIISGIRKTDTINRIPVVAKLNWMVAERTLRENILTANIDFYTHQKGRYYHEFQAADYFRLRGDESQSDLVIKAGELFESCYYRFLHRMDNELGFHVPVNEFALGMNALKAGPDFMLQNKDYQNGIYYTFDLFRDHIKDTLSFFGERKNIRSAKMPREAMDFVFPEVNIDHVWGVDFDGVTYIRFDDLFFPAFQVDNNLYINVSELKKKSNIGKGTLIGFISTLSFGIGFYAASGLIITPFALAVGTGLGTIIGAFLPRYSYQTTKFSIDYFSGKPVFQSFVDTKFKKPYYEKIQPQKNTGSGMITLYLPQKAHTNLELSINGATPVEMPSNSFYTYRSDTATEYCLSTQNDQVCDKLYPSKLMPVAYEIFLEKDGKISCLQIDDESTMKKYKRWANNGSLRSVNN